jgi:cytochrome c peroxidase
MTSGSAARALFAASLAMAPVLLCSASAVALESIELLGKNVFFDESLSRPANKQGCISCHDPVRGWTLPNAAINRTTVVAPGAKPGALGSIKVPTNSYATFSPVFQSSPAPPAPPWLGGSFWDGRAEGCGATAPVPIAPCPIGKPDKTSETIKLSDLPVSKQGVYAKFLGPVADQALNPFPNDVEQNIREKNVCQGVKTAKYKKLYDDAFGEPIDCSPNPKNNPAYRTSFKRIAVALAAWQASSEVNSFSSKRDKALKDDPDHAFPLEGPNVRLTTEENRGHDLFYNIQSPLNPGPSRANCRFCHNNKGALSRGEEDDQLYTDFRYHNIGAPFNREIPGVAKGKKDGLATHLGDSTFAGDFKTPPMRNVGKGAGGGFTKAYAHNGWFKSLESIVHFYNTRDALPRCETLGITDATEKEALANNCWPASEFANPVGGIIGRLNLNAAEEAAIVAYLRTLSDDLPIARP